MKLNATPNAAQKAAMKNIERRHDFDGWIEVRESGMGSINVEWYNWENQQWQVLITSDGRATGERQIWC